MKSVLISIQPKWVEKIAKGEKTIEVRKTRPKIETPFKCYIYCTKGEQLFNNTGKITKSGVFNTVFDNHIENINGKVIGEFVCDSIICSQAYFDSQGKNHLTNIFEEDIKRTCLTEYELWNYIAGKTVKSNQMYDGYLWHISNLKIYDKPKELSEFTPICKVKGEWCDNCIYYEETFGGCCCVLSRPPQSWCYVEG